MAPLSLPPSDASLLENVRIHSGTAKTRSGDVGLEEAFSGLQRGAFEATLDEVEFSFRASSDSEKVTVWYKRKTDPTWLALTPTAGPYGDLRFEETTSESLQFSVVRDRSIFQYRDHDLVVIQDGSGVPRIFGASTDLSSAFNPDGTLCFSKVAQPSPPANVVTNPQFSFTAVLSDNVPVFHNDDAGITSAAEGSGNPHQYVSISIGTDYVEGNLTVWDISPVPINGGVGDAPTQLVLVGYSENSTGSSSFWQQVKIEIDDGSDSWVTIYDPSAVSDAVFAPIATEGARETENWWQMGFPLSSVTLSIVRHIRWSWQGAIPTVSPVVGYMATIAAGGRLPGGSRAALAFYGSDSRSLGPATISTRISDLSVYQAGGAIQFNDIKIVEDPRFYFDYFIDFDRPSDSERDQGIDYVLVFRSDPGQAGYYLVGKSRIAHWTGSAWVFDFALSHTSAFHGDQDLSFAAPDPSIVVTPVGKAMVSANGRFFVGSGSRLWFSEAERPFSFRKSVRFLDESTPDPYSAGSITFDGQTVQAIVPLGSFAGAVEELSTPISGAATLHVLTDRNLFQLSGFDAKSLSRSIPIAPYGTLSPMSVGRSKTGFYWLDDRGQVCYFSPQGLSRLSVALVDDMTTTIPEGRKAWAWGACANDRYYLAFSPPGSNTNDKILVWNEQFDAWESVDTGVTPAQALIPFYSDGYVKLLRFSDTALYEHEQPGNKSNVNFKIVFREYTAGDLSNGPKRLDTGAMTVWVDGAVDGYTLTCKRVDPSTGAEAEGTIEVGSAPRAIYVDTPSTGLAGDSIQPSIEGSVPGGTKFHGVWLNMSSAPSGAIGS